MRSPGKRTSATGPSSARGCRGDGVLDKCHAIGGMLQSAEGYPRDVLDTLSNSAHSCLITPREKRHEFQQNIIRMIREVLESVECNCVGKAAGLKTKLAHADSEKITREAALKSARAQEQACKEFLEAAQKALQEAEAARKVAEKSVRDLGPEMRKAAQDAQLADTEVSACRGVLRTFRVLEGDLSQPPASPKVVAEGEPSPLPPAAAVAATAAQADLVEEAPAKQAPPPVTSPAVAAAVAARKKRISAPAGEAVPKAAASPKAAAARRGRASAAGEAAPASVAGAVPPGAALGTPSQATAESELAATLKTAATAAVAVDAQAEKVAAEGSDATAAAHTAEAAAA